MRKFLLATMAILWLLTGLGGKLVAQENIAVWKFPSGVTDVTCVSDRISASDCSFSSEGTVLVSGTNSSNTSLCGDTDDTKSLQVSGQAGGSVIFKISAAPYSSISISYDLRGHPNMTYHGYTDYVWSYSTNGTTFTDAPVATAISGFTETTFTAQTADFSSISALNGSNEVWFKLTMSGAEGASVASNIDNVVFSGTPLTCLTPVNMTAVANDAPTQAVVSWSPAGDNEESYTLVYYTSALSNDALNSFLSVSQYASYVATNATSPHTLTNLNAGTHYYVYVRANCDGDDNSLWANADVTTPAVCTISGLEATAVAGSTASLSWTTGAGSTMIRVFTAAKNNPWEATDGLFLEETVSGTSYDLTGLSFSTTYHVYAKSVCSANNISETVHTSFTTNFADNVSELTVNNGTTTNEYVPVYGYYVDNISKSQFIIPASGLDDMVDGTIHQLKFYCSQSSVNFGNARFKVYIGETTATTLSSTTPNYSGMTEVYAGALSISGGMMQIDLATPYLYNGGNLMIGVLETTSGSYSYTYWYGVSQSSNTSIGGYGSYDVSYYQFLPKTTFTYSPAVYSCPKPTNLAAGNVTPTSATITWLAGGEEIAWTLKYGPAGFDVETAGTEVSVETTPSYELTGLTANTAYDVYVKAVCSDTDESAWRMFSFRTTCAAITSFPWTETFESYSSGDFTEPCWVNEHISGGGSYIFKVSTYTNGTNTTHQLQLPDMTGGTLTKLVLPEMNFGEVETAYVFSIDVYRSNNTYNDNNIYEGVRVFANTSGTLEGATELAFIPRQYNTSNAVIPEENVVGWYTYSMDIPITTGTCYIILRGESQYCTSTYMDNLLVRKASSAAEITAFSFAEDAEAAVINSTDATVTSVVSYQTESLNGLVPTIAISERATIAPESGVAQDFSSSVTYTVTAEDRTTTKVWTVNVSKVATASSAKDILSFSFSGQQGESVIDAENHTVLAYVAWNYDLTLATNKIAPTITVSPLARIYPVSDSAINFAAPVTYTVTAEDESTQQWTVTIQNDPNACVNPLPATFVVSDLTPSTATLAWVRRYTETSYNVKVSTTAISVSDIATTDGDVYNGVVNDTTITLTGLAENTMYYVYVQSACGVQTWVSKSFRTIITPATIPYIYAFEDATENEAWVLENGSQTNKWYIGTASNNGGNGLYISNDGGQSNAYTISTSYASYVYAYRTIEMTVGDYVVSYDWKGTGESTYDYMRVFLVPSATVLTAGSANGINTTNVPTGWIALDGASKLNLQSSWQSKTVTVGVNAAGTYNLVFYWRNDTGGGDNPPASVDNISVTKITCPVVADIETDNITTTSADITWTERGTATAWDVVFSATALTDEQLAAATPETVNAASYQATELTQNTPYYIYVRAHCSDEDQSDWSAAQFRTECGDQQIPYSQNFNDYTATTYSTAGIMPDCWRVNYSGTSQNYAPHVCNYSYYGPGSDNYLIIVAAQNETVGQYSYAIFPHVEGGYANRFVSFDKRISSVSNGTLSLGYMNGNNFVSLTDVTVTTSGSSFSYIVPNTVPSEAMLAFRLAATSTSYAYLGIDNVLVRETATDNTILSYSASTEQGDAICSVDNDAHTISVELRAGYVAGNGIRQTIVPTDPNATVKQLVGTEYITPNPYIAWHMTTSDTIFVYKVTAENGAEQLYDATITVESCAAPSALVAEQTSTTNVNCSWTPGEGTTAWNFYCSTTQLTPAGLDALTASDYTTVTTASASATVVGETTYYWYVRADCSGSYSAWLEGTFSTWENCVAPTDLATSLAGDNDVLITWNVQDNLPLAPGILTDDFERETVAGGSVTYTNDATYPWVITDAAANGGTHSIKSGNYHIGSSTSSISITANYPSDGTISFYGRVSSEQTSVSNDWDNGRFYIDGVQQGSVIINTTTFSHFTYNVTAGTHTFKWEYKKDGSFNSNDDCFYVDDITMPGLVPGGNSSVVLYKNDVELVTLPATQTSYTDEGLEAGHYCYTIKTVCREGSESELSAPVCQDINDCLAVTNLSAGSVTDNSAVISWTRGTETSWNLKVNDGTPVALTETTEDVTVNGDVISYALTGLEQNTTYTVAIQSNCDGTLSQNWVSVEFTTERTPAALPYVYGFEDAAENANWVFANGTYTNKWYIGPAANHGGANGLYISGDNGQTNTYAESSSYVYAYREINFASAGDYIVSFDWIAVGEGSYSAWDAMYAALVPYGTACPPASDITGSTNSLPAGYINVADVSQSYITTGAFLWTYTASDWQTSTMTIPISAPGVYTLVFYWKNDSSDGENPPAAVDNINIRALTCPAVDNLAVATSGITSNSAVITWTEHGTAEAWEVIVSATEVTDFDAATKVPVTADTYTATGLHAETTYHVYVRANCDVDDNSDWVHTTFTTLVSCPAPEELTAPALTITNNSAVITWTERGSAEAWEVVVSQTAVTDFTSATAVPVTENTHTATGLDPETTYHVYVRANCDVDDNSQWTHATFTTVASCPVPDGLATSAITGNSATITWNGYTASNWTLEYATSSSFTGATSVTVNDNPTADLTGLAAQTTYYVRVKAVCEDDAESAYSSIISFATTCAAITEFPWNEGFENGIDCWTLVDGDADGYEWYEINLPQADQDNLLSTHGGSYMMTSASWVPYTALTPNNWLISPGLDLTALSGTVKLSYFVGGHQTEWPSEHYKVCVSTSTDTASFTTILFEETIPTSGWLERYVDLSSYVGQTIYIAFVHYNCTDMFRLDLDDISVYVDTSTDAAITGITAPTHGNYSTCALTDAEQIKVNIINNGGAAISDFEVSYSINGGTPVTETVTASIAPAQTYEYTFAQTADLSLIGDYTITASVNLTGDETADNDTASMTITSGDATIRIHALTDSGSGQSWSVTNTITNEVVAGTTTGWQWEVEVNEYVCVDATQCYSVVVNDEDGMSSPAYVEILYNGVQVAGSTNGGSFTGPSLVADRFSPACQSSENDIITFSVPDMLSVDIDNEHHTVTAEISYASTENLSAIVPTITVSEYAEITLVGDVAYVAGNAQDFTNPVVYTVVAENGTPQTWNVIVTRSTNASSEKDIIDFTFAGQVGESVIDPTEHTVTAFASWNISLEDPITPTIVVSPMATISPESGVAQNFSAPVTYTVTAEDQSTQEWIVTITQDSSSLASLPYSCSFEDATENSNWVLENGSQNNKWYIGSAANHGGANGLYISDNNGTRNNYSTGATYVYAYRQINVAETGHYDISFDWLANGESNYDLLRAFAIPTTLGSNIVAGNANGMTSDVNTNPTGWIDIANPAGKLNLATEWQTSESTVELNAGAYNLVFFWKNDGSVQNQTPAAVDNVSIARSTFTITASAEGLGSITPVGDTVVADGATVVFTMTPMSGFALSALTVDGVDQLSQVVNNTYTFENVSADHTIVATFEPAIIINATAGNGGSISPAGEVSVGAHSNATFTITAGEGYIISSVLVDNEEVLNDNTVRTTYNYTFTNVTASHTIAASFVAAEPHYITATAGNGGSISPSGRVEVAYNGSQTFEFTPDEGYSLANIVVDNGPATAENNTYTFTNVIDDHTINANFAVNSYNLTIHYVYADSTTVAIAPDYTESVAFGAAYSVASPEIAGYTADQLTVAGTMPAQDVTVTVRYTANNYNLTIHYVYEDNTEARPDYTAQFAYGAEYLVESPVIECYTANTPVVEGTMPAEDHVVTVTYTVDTYTLTIHYVYADNTAISDSIMQVACGATYSVESPVIDGYTANPAVVEGTMPAENHEVTVTYNEIVTHTLTIHYVYAETNAQAADDHTEILAEGAAYSVPSPVIDGYTADQTVVAGTMGTADITVTVTYTENAPVTHTLTIHYVYAETNAQAAADYTATLAAGESYSVASPVIAGYTADQATVAGTMPAQDVEVTVRYTANPVNTYTITATAGNGGTINPLGTVTVNEGADKAFTITADAGYRIASVLVDGADAISELVNNVYTFVNVTANHTIAVTFAPVSSTTYTIIATAGANGTITPNGVITVNEGATQTFRITPNNGYRIATVMVDDVNVINDVVDFQYTFYNVTADHRINVTFTNGDAVDEYTAGSMSVYPNPNNGMFSIEFANINGDATYQLIDARGAVVETRDINVMNGDTMNFDYNLRPGAYFVRIITTDRVYVEQIVVE